MTTKRKRAPSAASTASTVRNTAGLRPWRPGQSGNPRGRRPVDPSLRELARANTRVAVETLVKITQDDSAGPSARVAAACALLDRGHGRPVSEVDLNVKAEPPKPRGLTPELVRQIQREVLGIDLERDAPPLPELLPALPGPADSH